MPIFRTFCRLCQIQDYTQKLFYICPTLYLLSVRAVKISTNLTLFKKVFSQNLGRFDIHAKSLKVSTNLGVFMDEIWLKIKEFPHYAVSSEGRVRNEDRGRIVQTSHTGAGVVKVGIVSGGKQHTRSVKVLVAEAFVEGATEQFNTPIHLDGDQENNTVGNLVWRPRWFAWKYKRQFEQLHKYSGVGPLCDRKTGLIYEDIVQVCLTHGFLFEEVYMSVVNKVPVFPTWHILDWVNE